MRKNLVILILMVFFGLLSSANADPINVSYTVSGSTGNWTLDFSVTDNLIGTDQGFYFFGVSLSSDNNTGSPTDYGPWTPQESAPWSNTELGGSSVLYNDTWVDDGNSAPPGTTTSGFEVTISDAVAPTAVGWYVFTTGGIPYCYTPLDCTLNPGFEGAILYDTVSGTSVSTTTYYPQPQPQPEPQPAPEPDSLILCATGLGLLMACGCKATA
jgi:hypothetical protein